MIAIGANISVSAVTNDITDKFHNTFVSKELIEKADKYVNIKNGIYVLDNSIYKDSALSQNEIEEVELSIENSNGILKESNKEYVVNDDKSLERVITYQEIKDAFEEAGANLADMVTTYATPVGVNKTVAYWWGFYIYLDSYYTGLVLIVAEAVAAAIFALYYQKLLLSQRL